MRPSASVSRELIDAVLNAAVAAGIMHDRAAATLRARLGVQAGGSKSGGGRLPERALLSVWGEAMGLAGSDHGVGMLLARHADVRAFGLIGEALHHTPTLLAAYEHIARYARLTHQGVTIAVEATAREVAVTYAVAGKPDDRAPSPRAAGLLWVMGNLALVPVRIFGVDLKPRAASLACRAPLDTTIMQAVFGAGIAFDAAVSRIIFDRRLVDEVPQSGRGRLLDYLDVLADRNLDDLPAVHDIVTVVASELRRSLVGGGVPMAKTVAHALGLSQRTLQRRIADAGATYEAILDDVRRARATELITAGGRTMSEIAYMLGYSEQAAFSRASRRWFGTAPSKFGRAP